MQIVFRDIVCSWIFPLNQQSFKSSFVELLVLRLFWRFEILLDKGTHARACTHTHTHTHHARASIYVYFYQVKFRVFKKAGVQETLR